MTNHVNRECLVCAVSYKADLVRLRPGRHPTGSRACSYVLRANKRKKGKTFECPVCEVEFTRTPSQIKSKHSVSYCSAACMYQGRTLGLTPRIVDKPYVRVAPINYEAIARAHATRRARNNYGHTDDTRARLSEATTRAIAEGRIAPVSKLEDEVAVVLDEL